MSLRDAIMNSARQTLSSYLAPELVEQLTEEIVHRVAPEVEAVWTSLAGFEPARPVSAVRVRGATPAAAKKAKARAPHATPAPEAATTPSHAAIAAHTNGNGGTEVQPSH